MTGPGTTWVVIDEITDPGVLLASARRLNGRLEAVVIGSHELATEVSTYGPDTTHRLVDRGHPDAAPEGYASAIAARATEHMPRALIFAASPRLRVLAGRVAAKLATAAITDATDLKGEDAGIVVTHPLYGGAASRTEQVLSPTAVVTVSMSAFAEFALAPSSGPGPVNEIVCEIEVPVAKLLSTTDAPPSSGELARAKVVVGAGRGMARADNRGSLKELAEALGAEIACTRPVAEEMKFMAHDRYLGISGLQISPELYLALGVSGQPQHMVGVERARTIVAINKDGEAPIFAQADYGIVGDLNELVPALIGALGTAP
ncbi:MAG: electron transfer flavoprotein subunit alpha/FixB family protein [Acidimicrobiales bacterium]